MKRKIFITALLIITYVFATKAQYTKLLDFSDSLNGRNPCGSLIYDGTFLYGMTQLGGNNEDGVVFKIKPDGTGYSALLDFSGTANGSKPYYGSLIFDGTFLYGMTYSGGAHDLGAIFKIKPDGTGYSDLYDFTLAGANSPFGSLITDGTFLYGMASTGGTNNYGAIFKIKTDGTAYDTLLNFNNANGRLPYGSLISDGTFLYGMTVFGGTNDYGLIFKIKTDGTAYDTLLNFNGVNGRLPYGSLISDGVFLYGMTNAGGTSSSCGSYGCGVAFKIKPDGTGYSKLLDFNSTNGSKPYGDLFYDGSFLYGMTEQGGTTSSGNIFKIKTDGTGYNDLLDFSGGSGGTFPHGTLISDGTSLYGTTVLGGTCHYGSGCGTIFKFHPVGMGITENQLLEIISVYPNPTSGVFNLQVEQLENLKIKNLKVYNVLSECVYQISNQQINSSPQLQIDLGTQPSGVYIIQMQTEQGSINKRLIIQN